MFFEFMLFVLFLFLIETLFIESVVGCVIAEDFCETKVLVCMSLPFLKALNVIFRDHNFYIVIPNIKSIQPREGKSKRTFVPNRITTSYNLFSFLICMKQLYVLPSSKPTRENTYINIFGEITFIFTV